LRKGIAEGSTRAQVTRGFESPNKVPFKRSILWKKFDAILPDNAAGQKKTLGTSSGSDCR
jgi:hypothetical protein